MLAYLQRTLPLFARAFASRETALVSRIERRVGVRDLDLYLHMNQAVYAQVIELGRADWFVRSGAFARWRRRELTVAVASQHIVYRRELRYGTRYVVDTRAVAMNGRLLVAQGHLIVGDRVHARADVEMIFKGPEGVLDAEAAAGCCEGLLTPALEVEDWTVAGTRD